MIEQVSIGEQLYWHFSTEGVVILILREAREGRGDLTVLWLNLANAYGSVPHKMLDEALKRHLVPGKISKLILDYYDNFQIRISSRIITSDWHRLERGIITGCTLFTLSMNMIAKSAEIECRGPIIETRVRHPPFRAYINSMTVTSTSFMGSRWILHSLEKLVAWARMKFKLAKSRLFIIKKGRTADNFRFQ